MKSVAHVDAHLLLEEFSEDAHAQIDHLCVLKISDQRKSFARDHRHQHTLLTLRAHTHTHVVTYSCNSSL